MGPISSQQEAFAEKEYCEVKCIDNKRGRPFCTDNNTPSSGFKDNYFSKSRD
jgi:hypothetical protein